MLRVKGELTGKIILLSDLHIWGPEDPVYRGLLRFLLEEVSGKASGAPTTLLFLGDIFDILVGSQNFFQERYKDFLSALESLQKKNVRVLYLEGNHDFQLKNFFKSMTHIECLSGECTFSWDNRFVYLAHGDLINPKDYKYRAFHTVLKNPISEFLLGQVPGKWVQNIGGRLSHASRSYQSNFQSTVSEETIRMFRNFACSKIANGFHFVMLGHSHYFDDIRFRVDCHEGQYINVGFPREDGQYFEISPGEEFFKPKSLKDYFWAILKSSRT